MLNLDGKLVLDKQTHAAANLTSRFSEDDLGRLGNWCWDGYASDKQSRSDWERRMNAAMDLALQLVRDKSFPWPNCSNVAFPLVTIAALQFHSRAYPALVTAPDLVKCRVNGEDASGELFARASRIASHMSYQVLEQDRSWEEQHDTMLINLPIVGCAFKKSYFDAREKHNKSELVLARDLVLNYWSKSVEAAERKTHVIQLSHNDVRERVLRGVYRDVLEEGWFLGVAQAPQTTTLQTAVDKRQGITPPQPDVTTPFVILEQHLCADLDGDGYAEPYIITVEESSKCVLRIVCRFARWPEDVEQTTSGRIIRIRSTEYFTKYPFIPSPDGGIYDLGFGVLLGPINETVNDLINKLNDAGTMQITAGGFLGRGAKIRGGVYTFSPFQWSRVDSSGDDLRKNIVPLPTNAPSEVLFNLLNMLVTYANRIPGTTEVLVGETPGQNTPAETSRNAMEQGLKLYHAIFKRIWRAMKDEFKKLYILNGTHLPSTSYYGDGKQGLREDYLGDPNEICPIADPNIVSDAAELQRITMIKQSAAGTPGYDLEQVERRFLKALKVDGIDQLYPGPEKRPAGPGEKVTLEQMKQEGRNLDRQWEQEKFAATLMEEQRLNAAQMTKLEAEAIVLMGNMEGDAEDRQVALINAELGMRKTQDETLRKRIDVMLRGMDMENKQIELHAAREKATLTSMTERDKARTAAVKNAAAREKARAPAQ